VVVSRVEKSMMLKMNDSFSISKLFEQLDSKGVYETEITTPPILAGHTNRVPTTHDA
jgi:hypothetical protein